LVPVERVKVLGTKWGKDYEFNLDAYNLKDIVGKPIRFSTNESICGLTTEPLFDLKTTFASDIQSAALVLLIKPDQNPERIWPPGNQVAILIGSFKILSAAEKVEADKAFAEKAAVEEKVAADAKAASFVCIPGSNCPIGSTGPGGGIVFYDAGSQQSWGRYLEVAPRGWYGSANDPTIIWCNVINQYVKTGVLIGDGKVNTDLLSAKCSYGAGVEAKKYNGGGKNDWFLPSKNELNELCKYVRNQPTGNTNLTCKASGTLREGFEGYYYWSSSESADWSAWFQLFVDGLQDNYKKSYTYHVRPVRAF
jgi:hypothetical protein